MKVSVIILTFRCYLIELSVLADNYCWTKSLRRRSSVGLGLSWFTCTGRPNVSPEAGDSAGLVTSLVTSTDLATTGFLIDMYFRKDRGNTPRLLMATNDPM